MNKIMKLEVVEGFDGDLSYLYENDCPYIFKKVNDIHGRITDEAFLNAIDILISACIERRLRNIYININERNNDCAPTKEMTLEEIEEALGYKVKIVNK